MKSISGWYNPIRLEQFPLILFAVVWGGFLLTSGIHYGLLVLMDTLALNAVIQSAVPIIYWMGMSAAVTLIIVKLTRDIYEKPLKEMAEATKKVAQGDFSVYVPTPHAADKLDYMDRMIQDFNKMVAELGSIETMKTDFIANVSHEIKTPLAVISNYAQMLKGGSLSREERDEALDTILLNVRRLADLVMNILKLNKIENQAIKPAAEPYDLCGQLSECALLFEDSWDRKRIDLEFETEDRAVIHADREMMALVWNNLLSNAIKFTPEGGTVRLTQTSEADAVVVTVSDTGCGMTPETMSHIFEKFYQGDASHSGLGNGLGLALALRILQVSGGTITVDSAVGEGSTFTVRLPVEGKKER